MIDVYIGGFSGSKKQARRTGDALAEYYGKSSCDVEVSTFAEAMGNAAYTNELVRGKQVVTHSAGALATKTADYKSMTAFAPPIPVRMLRLLGRGAMKPLSMTAGAIGEWERQGKVLEQNVSSALELMQHPYGNFRHLGVIAQHDSVELSIASFNPARVAYMQDDEFGYTPQAHDMTRLRTQGVVVETLRGVHDELVLFPQKTVASFEAAISH